MVLLYTTKYCRVQKFCTNYKITYVMQSVTFYAILLLYGGCVWGEYRMCRNFIPNYMMSTKYLLFSWLQYKVANETQEEVYHNKIGSIKCF